MATYQDRKGKVFKTREEAKASNLAMDAAKTPATTVTTPAPGATDLPIGLSDAMKYGAAGRGEVYEGMTDAQIKAYNKKLQAAMDAGVPMAEMGSENKSGKSNFDNPRGFEQPRMSEGAATRYLASYGLSGMLDPKKFSGMKIQDAERAMMMEYKKRQGQISANTSFAFNPEMMKRTQRAIDKFNFALDEADKDPFEPKQYKDESKQNLLDVTSKELGQLFTNPNDIYNTYKTNAQFKSVVDAFIKKGGTIEGIAKNVSTPAAAPVNSLASAVQDLMRQGITDPAQIENFLNYDEAGNKIGSATPEEVQAAMTGKNNQSPADYLSSLTNPNANKEAEKMALEELSPETDIAQEEILRQSNIPNDLKKLYFGDEKSIGILQMKQQQAQEEVRLLEEKEKDEKRSARDKSKLAIEKNNAELKIAEAKVEENRLAAKNYMTARLAQLGALQTTGAAVLAIQTLETKYQLQVNEMKFKTKYANKELELNLAEKIDTIENDTDDKILTIQEDLTKDSETMYKEVLKEQQAAEKEIYRITEQYGRRLRERTTAHTEDLKRAAEKYAKEYAEAASGGRDFTGTGSVKSKSKIISETENKLEESRGDDTFVNSEVYYQAYKDWIKRGGTAKSFIAQFPPKYYANPDDPTLPANLRYARESQTLSSDDEDDDLAAQIAAAFPDEE